MPFTETDAKRKTICVYCRISRDYRFNL